MQITHTDNRIVFDHVSFRYGDRLVLSDISAVIPMGSYVGVVGPNGGGKTTLLHLLVGLLTPTSGTITIFGHPVSAAKEHVEIGFVPQRAAQIDPAFPATVEEIVLSGRTRRLRFGRSFSANDHAVVAKALSMARLEELRHRPMGSLSGGQVQRVFIARALAAEPKVLILDEPTVGVDARSMDEFYALLHELHVSMGITIFLVSHDVDVVAREATTVLCVNERLVAHVPSAEFHKERYGKELYDEFTKPVDHEHDATPL